MKFRPVTFGSLVAAISLTCGLSSAAIAAGRPKNVKEEILVRPAGHLSEQAVKALFTVHGGEEVDSIPRIYVRVLRVPAANRDRVLDALRNNPNIEFAEANAEVKASVTANDPYYNSEWHLGKVQAPLGWDYSTGSAGAIIAVVDTGVALTHPDFAGKILAGYDFVNGDADPTDDNGHGTSVAGLAAATGNNGIGIAGIAWQNMVLPVKVLDSRGAGTSDVLCKGIMYAADRGARIINVSLGTYGSASTLQAAVDYAWSKNALIVAACGNDATTTFMYPAACARVLGVSATTNSDTLATFSNYGSYVSLAAPGQSVWTINGASYGARSGTSFSSPIVAGAAGLIAALKPLLTPAQISSILTQNTDDIGAVGYDTSFGYGRLNVFKALFATSALPTGDTSAPTVSITSPSAGSTVSGLVSVKTNAADNVGVNRVELYVGGILEATSTTQPAAFSWDTRGDANGPVSLYALAYDAAGNVADSGTLSVTVNNVADTIAPTTRITSPASNSVVALTTKIKTASSDNVAVTRVELYIDQVYFDSSTSAAATFSWNTKTAAKGYHTLQTIAYDASGNVGVSPIITVLK